MRIFPLTFFFLLVACTTADDPSERLETSANSPSLPPVYILDPPPPPGPRPDWLDDLTFEEVLRYLGQPDNQDGPSQSESGQTFGRSIDYFNETCIFSVWFRRNTDTPWRVHSFYAYDRNGEAVEIIPCVESHLRHPAPG